MASVKMLFCFSRSAFAVLLIYTFYVFVERPVVISFKLVDDFFLKYFQFQWDSDDGGDKQCEQESRACGSYLSEKRSEPAPAFVETHDDIAVQIENEYAPEDAEAYGRRRGLKHSPERVAA